MSCQLQGNSFAFNWPYFPLNETLTSTLDFVPDNTKDNFWGENTSIAKHTVKARPLTSPEPPASLLDTPVPSPQQARKQSPSPLKQSQSTLLDGVNECNDTASTITFASTTKASKPKRFPPRLLKASVITPSGVEHRDTIEQILDYLKEPPRPKRWIPDFDDVRSLDVDGLRTLLGKVLSACRYLERENERLEKEGKGRSVDDGAGLKSDGEMAWQWGEHMDLLTLMEKDSKEIEAMPVAQLKSNIAIARQARKQLVEYNERLIG